MKFNKTLEAVNIMVMASYPAARFYEAQGILIEENNSLFITSWKNASCKCCGRVGRSL